MISIMCHGIVIQMYANDTVLYTHAKAAEPSAGKMLIAMERITTDHSCLRLNIHKKVNVLLPNQTAHQC